MKKLNALVTLWYRRNLIPKGATFMAEDTDARKLIGAKKAAPAPLISKMQPPKLDFEPKGRRARKVAGPKENKK